MSDKWKLIAEVHQHTKELLTLAEEISPGLKSFIPPVKEQRDALEHIIRAKAYELDLKKVDNQNYVEDQIDKTLGHIYRAFFDAADYFCILMRKRIRNAVTQYDSEIIKTVLPNYYSEIRPKLENINLEISKIRQSKDIAKKEGLIDEVEKYRQTTLELYEHAKAVETSIPSLNELKRKKSNEKVIDRIITSIITIVILFGINAVFKLWFTN